MALILDGKSVAETIRKSIKSKIDSLPIIPGLAVLLIGNDPASHTYVSIKQKACEEVGIRFEKFLYPDDIDEITLINKIDELNKQKDIHGILVQLPLPNQNADQIIETIDPKKDVDGFHPKNLASLRHRESTLAPAVAMGIIKLIEAADQNHIAKTATIVSSDLFAEPLTILLRKLNVTSTISRPEDSDFKQKTSSSDILIVALGKPRIIKAEFVKQNAIVIDVGTTKINGKLFGDVDRESVEPIVSALSPVPGGVGPMTVAMLLSNVLQAYQTQK